MTFRKYTPNMYINSDEYMDEVTDMTNDIIYQKPVYQKPVYVDVDDTLVLWDVSAHPEGEAISVDFAGYTTHLVKHTKNINLVIKFAKLGYDVIVHSQTGHDWAEAISQAIGLDEYVKAYATKPKFYIDDLDASTWIGQRVWRSPSSGSEKDDYLTILDEK